MSADELDEFRDSLRALLTKHAGSAALRESMTTELGYDPKLWTMLCEQIGVAGLAVPEKWGGAGATLTEALLVVGELGRVLSGVPMLGSAVLATQALQLSGDDDACERLLPDLASGERTAALCWAGAKGWDETPIRVDNELLTGTAHYVLHGTQADVLLALTNDGLYEVDPEAPGVTRTPTPALDPTRQLATITFTDTPARRIATADLTGLRQRLREIAWTALAAEQVAAARYCLDQTVEYTSTRVQFGRPIGGFQALKHRMADMYVLVESADSAAQLATNSLASEADSSTEDAWVARKHCTAAFEAVAAEMIQLHGGIAITWEHDAHLYFKRAHATSHLFGQSPRPT
ncbi:acyl-CoA dehydrogenase family protein [Nocardia camponoti]|uniref:Acyl-CoA dehydrogenase n=1 Tax=Nocardia camponoti TaxID=1616106 RepID=A0A917QNL7_9NOCA|nr:acyl-CoA dehydrogenase family protein [Nocardia camponoti]GGK59794.1 acyl-CoA dehydrogenase [Nocardia camponoti]